MDRSGGAARVGRRVAWALACAALACFRGCGSDDGGREDGSADTEEVPGEARPDDGGNEADEASPDAVDGDGAPEDAAGDDSADPRDIFDRLASVPGLTVEDLGGDGTFRFFGLAYRQPADHADPGGPGFTQYMTLSHRSTDAPMVLMTEGYANMWDFAVAEVALLTRANQLVVEHRFFGRSRPVPTDWSLLTIEQAAADHHRIVEALRPIYAGAWISTGYSKGGMTAVYHRRFHPDDVAGTVAYVAPISFGAPDARYLDFVAGAGDAACRDGLYAVQREALSRRDALIPRIGTGPFVRIGGVEAAFETVVIELPFAFWQYWGESYCPSVPGTPAATDAALYSFIDTTVGFDSAADGDMDWFAPYYYQAQAELGFPDVERGHLAGLLRTDVPSIEEGVIPPGAPVPAHDPAVMEDVAGWVAAEGEALLFVYGQYDPWTAGAFELGAAADSYRLVVPGGTHMSGISDLPAAERAVAVDALGRWAGVEVHSLPSESIPRPRFPRAPAGR